MSAALARKIVAAKGKPQHTTTPRPCPRRVRPVARPVVPDPVVGRCPPSRLKAACVRLACTMAMVAGLCAAWGMGVIVGSISVPAISVVEVHGPSILPKCAAYDREKGVCAR